MHMLHLAGNADDAAAPVPTFHGNEGFGAARKQNVVVVAGNPRIEKDRGLVDAQVGAVRRSCDYLRRLRHDTNIDVRRVISLVDTPHDVSLTDLLKDGSGFDFSTEGVPSITMYREVLVGAILSVLETYGDVIKPDDFYLIPELLLRERLKRWLEHGFRDGLDLGEGSNKGTSLLRILSQLQVCSVSDVVDDEAVDTKKNPLAITLGTDWVTPQCTAVFAGLLSEAQSSGNDVTLVRCSFDYDPRNPQRIKEPTLRIGGAFAGRIGVTAEVYVTIGNMPKGGDVQFSIKDGVVTPR